MKARAAIVSWERVQVAVALTLVVFSTQLLGCALTGPVPGTTVERWGTIDGRPVHLYTLKNDNGLMMRVTNYGATITELHVPDRSGQLADIVLGYDSLAGYIASSPYFGCIAGRCANRIADGRFTLDGTAVQLARNNGPHHLHGGVKGFDKHVWEARLLKTADGPALRLERTSPVGEENYPGELRVVVTYTLSQRNELITDIEAHANAPTLCNLAQHTYWNLAGHASGPVDNQVLTLYASHYTPVSPALIPTGERAPVAGTPFDFTQPKPIGRDRAAVGGTPVGYDHNFVVNGSPREMRPVARVLDPASGRIMELSANQPGVQFYGGNFLDGTLVGKGGVKYPQYGGFCLETQCYPNAINVPAWVQPVLRPGETYHHRMVTRFTTDKAAQ